MIHVNVESVIAYSNLLLIGSYLFLIFLIEQYKLLGSL